MREVIAFLPYVLRSIARARMRTALTLIGSALAMGLFTFVRAMDVGVSALERASGARALVVFQDSRFCPSPSELPLRYRDAIATIEGVEAVLPALLFVNSCRANLDLVTLHGVPRAGVADVHDYVVREGSQEDFRARDDGALVGARLAARRGVRAGDRVRLGPLDVHVSAIIEGAGSDLDNVAFVGLEPLGLARQRAGSATQFHVTVAAHADPDAVARAIDARFATDAVRTRTRTHQAFVASAVAEISEVLRFARHLGYLAVAVMVLILANTQLISIGARRVELSVLEAIGLPRREVLALTGVESLLLALAGGALGALLVAAALHAHPVTLGVEGHGIDFRPTAPVIAQAVLASVLAGVLAALPACAARRHGGGLASDLAGE